MFLTTILVAVALPVAETPDTLQSVTLVADRVSIVSRKDTVSFSGMPAVSDALLQSPSLLVNDNGGFAGLKTVSLRGLGSAHTAIYVDGLRLGNVQSGQSDLGMLDVGSFSAAVVDYAQNSVSFVTPRPEFKGRNTQGRVALGAASFGSWLPSASFSARLSDRLSLTANASGTVSRGDYPLSDGTRRENNDIRQFRGGLDFFGLMDGGDWHAKAFVNTSRRGTPGSLSWPSNDRQQDMNSFVQAMARKAFSPRYSLTLSGKLSYDDLSYSSSWGDSRYRQTELQINSSHKVALGERLSLSVAADLWWDGLSSAECSASRLTVLSSAGLSFKSARFSLDASLEYQGAFDKGASGRNCLSPSLEFRMKLAESLDLLAFGRRAYRVPTFNELYYAGYGNPDLSPEDALLADIGLDFSRTLAGGFSFNAGADAFLNWLQDKIASAPSAVDPNIWQPFNIGKVKVAGLDLSAGMKFRRDGFSGVLDARYGFQDARDRTPDAASFDSAIPYVARHSAVLSASLSWRGYGAGAVWNLRAGRKDSYGDMPSWNTLDLRIFKDISFAGGRSLKLSLSGKNITDCRYELSTGYPMPGASVVGGIEFDF